MSDQGDRIQPGDPGDDEFVAQNDHADGFPVDSDPGEGPSDANVDSLRDLMTYLITNLVDEPETIDLEIDRHGSTVQIRVNVPQDDLGKVIGRGGRVAKAMRTALMVAGSRHHLRVSLDIEGKPVT
jgi:predicted RNA-binding protein YlqC (UPF0109 family)